MAKIIPKRTIEEIRFRSDIVDVVTASIPLKKAGSTFKACCPFHKEKTPSFHVNPQRQIYHCFGCGAGGDVFGFIMQYEGVDFTTAVQMLAERAGVRLEVEEGGPSTDKTTLYRIHSEVAALYHKALKERRSADHARTYLAERGLDDAVAGEFMIGYAPDRWDSVLRWGQRQKISMQLLEQSGLVIRSQDTANRDHPYYDRFRNRLMFPIFDEQGRVIAFSGRLLDAQARAAKYVNSPETPLFKKSRVLYGLDKARRAIVDVREALLCEGQVDVIRCHQAELCNAVAAQGTAFTESHVQVLRRYADSVVLAFDTDKAGQDAAIKTAILLIEAGLAVRILRLPEGEDPDSFIRANGAAAFRGLMKNAASTIEFQLDVLSARSDTRSEIGTVRAAKAVLDTIRHSPNAVQRAKMIQEAATRLAVPATALQDDLRALLNVRSRRRAPEESGPPSGSSPKPPPEEISLCEHLCHIGDHPELADLVEKYLPMAMLSSSQCRRFVETALRSRHEGRALGEALQEVVDPAGDFQRFRAAIEFAPSKIRDEDMSHEDAVRDLIMYLWKKELRRRRDTMASAEDSVADRAGQVQLTQDMKAMRNWNDASLIIEDHIENASGKRPAS
jgi:DNA primase